MLEYHELMLRPILYPGGRVHYDPERQSVELDGPRSPAVAAGRHRRGRIVVLGGILLTALSVL